METLNLQEHSLGILAVLCVKFSLPNPNGANNVDAYKPLFNQVQEFIIGCNGEQVRFASDICKFLFFSLSIQKYLEIFIFCLHYLHYRCRIMPLIYSNIS